MGTQTRTYTVTAGRKFIFIDVETTGLVPGRNAIWQIGAIVEIDGEVKERFSRNMKPHADAVIEDKALAVGGITRADLEGYQDQAIVFVEFRKFLLKYIDSYNPGDKFLAIGYNILKFDEPFLRAWFRQNNNKYYGSFFWQCPIDVYSMAADACQHFIHKMKNMKLETVARVFGIPIPDAMHDAGNDIEVTRRLYYCLHKKDLYAATFFGEVTNSKNDQVPVTGLKGIVIHMVSELMNTHSNLMLEEKLVQLCYQLACQSQHNIANGFKSQQQNENLPGLDDVKAQTDAHEFIERGNLKPWYLVDDYD